MVTNALQDNIFTGKLKVGERLPTQETLVRQFGVSRAVMREALHTFSSLGVISLHQGRGTFIRYPDTKTQMDPIFSALINVSLKYSGTGYYQRPPRRICV